MKTETQIAKENVEIFRNVKDYDLSTSQDKYNICHTHLKSCERSLEFLEKDILMKSTMRNICSRCDNTFDKTDNKIKDFQGAIKAYEDGGVR